MTRKIFVVLAALVALGMLASASGAAVTFDPATSTGFVGKGDVQLALNLNNAQLQAQASSLSFTYSDEVTYEVPCLKEGKKETTYRTFNRETSINATVLHEMRKNNQGSVTGFILTGAGNSVETGNTDCPGGWDSDGDPVLVAASGGVLSVNNIPLQ